ncbi:MAG: type IV pilin [Thermoplasmata archaeon]|nr:type IV pilin [Thermoplasmata archaeon]
MKVRENKKGVSPVIATILMVAITVVLAAVLYVMVMGMMTGPGTVQQPLGIYAKYMNSQRVQITVNSAPPNCLYNGSTVTILNGTTGVPTTLNSITVYRGATTVATGTTGALTSAGGSSWAAGDVIMITLSGTNYVSVGDKVQITGTGFSTSTATVTT